MVVNEKKMELITERNIDIQSLFDQSHNQYSGAIVLFSGEVRSLNKGRDVLYLEYEAYKPMAEKMIREILQEAKEKWNLNTALCVHRVGSVDICDCAVVVITASPHRSQAYEANQHIINRVKNEVPIWKHEFFADGTSEWGNNCDCHHQQA